MEVQEQGVVLHELMGGVQRSPRKFLKWQQHLCTGFKHCKTCRENSKDGERLRNGIIRTFKVKEFICPRGLNIGDPVKNIVKVCKFPQDTGIKVIESRPCLGNWIICHNPKNELSYKDKVIGKECQNCKFRIEEEVV